MEPLLDAALAWHATGAVVVPVCADGSKAPGLGPDRIRWRGDPRYAAPDLSRLLAQVGSGASDGVGLLCGAVSGGLEMLELEGRAVDEGVEARYRDLLDAHGLLRLWERVGWGYAERTPTGGLHLLYRVIDGAGQSAARRNTVLARRPATAEDLAADPGARTKVLMETRGEGGFVVVAPSAGRTHPTGGAWTVVRGDPAGLATLSPEDRDSLWAVATLLDATPVREAPRPTPSTSGGDAGQRPGDDFNARATWEEILTPHGWACVHRIGPGWAWRRPGKGHGVSATTGTSTDGADRLYVFSTSTCFDAETPYSKFGALAVLDHGGDHAAAARALRAAGYGTTRPTFTVLPGGAQRAGGHGPGAPGGGAMAADGTPGPEPVTTTHPRNEDGHALALIDAYGETIRYCTQRGQWLAWEGGRWAWQGPHRDAPAVREAAKHVARAWPTATAADAAHARRSLSAAGVTACLQMAATDPRVTVDVAALDADPWSLGTPGGTIDLRTGRLRPPDPADLITRSTSCGADPGADPTAWLEFLAETFGGDAGLVDYVRRLIGCSSVGTVREHVLPFAHGSGGNGKGVFLESLAAVLGDYATTAPAGFLMAGPAQHETEVARLAGARLVVCSEVDEAARFDEAKIKLLTGGDRLTARFMRRDHFTFAPTHQLWLAGNHKPAVRSGGRAFWRRLRLVPFAHEVPEASMVADLAGTLARDHGPALLAWVVAGATAYATHGLAEPPAVTGATAGWAEETDTVARFVADMCHLGGGTHVRVRMADVRTAYERWCANEGEAPTSVKAFGQALRTRHPVAAVKGSKGQRYYTGLTLLVSDDDDTAWT